MSKKQKNIYITKQEYVCIKVYFWLKSAKMACFYVKNGSKNKKLALFAKNKKENYGA